MSKTNTKHMKTHTSHTPGPWAIKSCGHCAFQITRDGFESQVVAISHGNEETAEANARLIAAAPCLLAALKRLFNCVPLSTEGPHLDSKIITSVAYWRGAFDEARAAIAKATGGDA